MRYVLVLLLTGCGSVEQVDHVSFVPPEAGLRVDIDAGDVRVVGAQVDTITIDRTVRGPSGHVATDAAVIDGVLEITGECPLVAPCRVDLVITVPAGLVVDVHTGSGKVELLDLAGGASVEVGDGRLDAHGLGGGRLHAQIGWGDAAVTFAGPPEDVAIGAAGGDVTLMVPAGSYALDVEAFAGEQVNGVAQDPAAAHVRVRASSGRVYVGRS